ncbi:MAG: response regulator [Desulfobacterales bacterium]|nr:response regulator [Desulfobacterales bacterium]
MKILVVEDDENSRLLQHYILDSAGYEVISAENGKDGLLLAESNIPDLIISDILMPVMDGYSLCREIRKNKKLYHIPFIFYTATYTSDKDKKLALDLGATKFIIKPMDPMEFLKNVKETLADNIQSLNHLNEKSPLELETEYSSVLASKLEKKVSILEEKQKELELSEQKYRRLVEVLHENYFFYAYDSNGTLTYISPSFTNVLGYTKEDGMLGIMKYLTDNPINKEALKKFELNLRGVRQSQYEVEMYHKNGSVRFLELTEHPVISNKSLKVEQIEGIAHDITERKLIESEKAKLQESLRRIEKNQALGTLASGISHDFNNILMCIIGYTEMLQLNLPKNLKWHSYIEQILSASKRASDLLKQILSFSRRTEQEKRPLKLQPIINEALELLRGSMPRTIEIQNYIDKHSPPVMADPTQIYEILINLCTNAYHAMREKGGILKVILSTKKIEPNQDYYDIKPGSYVCIEVIDNGCGIEKNIQDRIFEPYFTTKPKGEGTGIGLAVVNGIVQNHNGYIKFYSEPQKGTKFYIYFPIAELDCKEEKSNSEDLHLKKGKGEHILVIDDDVNTVRILKDMIVQLNYRVTCKTNSLEALSIFKSESSKFDLVMTDFSMPNIDGITLSKELLKVRSNIPIILCTSFNEIINEENTKEIGIYKYLMKPVTLRTLSHELSLILF